MKVTQATINYYLKTAKVLSDGTHPIMLRVSFHGFKDVSSHYSCSAKHWDKKNQCVKKGFPNYVMINSELNKLKAEIVKRRDEYIHNGIQYTPQMLLKEEKKVVINTSSVQTLIDMYCADKALSKGTCRSWKLTKNLLNDYYPNLEIFEVDEAFAKSYGKWLKDVRKLSEGYIRLRVGHLGSIYTYAAQKGLVSMDRHPFKSWKYTSSYKNSEKILYVNKKSIEVMKDMFLSKVIEMTGERRFTYVDDSYVDYRSSIFPLYFWLLGYHLQGMSPVDICLLKKNDFVINTIKGEQYYCINTSRQKTNVGVKVRVKVHTIVSQVLIGRMLMTDGEWFLPLLNDCKSNDLDALKQKVGYIFSHYLNKGLKDVWSEVNQEIIKRNVEGNLNIPLVNKDCTFYSYRHSFAQAYLLSGGNVLSLATLLGRSVEGISTYVQQLTEEEELVEAVSFL